METVKSLLKILEEDISFLRDFNVSLPSEIATFLERMNSRYASAIEKIVRDDESGYSDLEDILVSVNETRLQQYQKAAKFMLQMTRKDLKNAFWFKDQFTLSQRIDDIEKSILRIDSSLTSKEPMKIEESINLYRDQINTLARIQDTFQSERSRSRLNISLKIFLWSIPILIGIWISGKFDNSTIFAFIVLISLLAVSSYLFVGSKRFEEVISQNKIILVISLFVLIVVLFLWHFYTPISSYFNTNITEPFGLLMAIIGLAFAMVAAFLKNIPETLAKRNFVVVISAIDENFSPRDEIIIPYSMENKRSCVITEIGVSIFAPGLSVLSEGKNILYKSMGGKSTKNGELKLLEVPEEAVPGEYTVELNWRFYVGSEKYTKTDRIKVNIVT